MNKRGFIKKLKEKTHLKEEQCIVINSIIEDTFLIGKRNKDKMIQEFIKQLKISEEEANEIYCISIGIISSEIKNKLRHPFKKDYED